MTNGDELAFPAMEMNQHYGIDRLELKHTGLTKREYFAGLAMQGILSNRKLQLAIYADIHLFKDQGCTSKNCIAFHALLEADELLKQLSSIN